MSKYNMEQFNPQLELKVNLSLTLLLLVIPMILVCAVWPFMLGSFEPSDVFTDSLFVVGYALYVFISLPAVFAWLWVPYIKKMRIKQQHNYITGKLTRNEKGNLRVVPRNSTTHATGN